MPIEKPPFEAYCTTCGVTFTFGGLRIDTDGRVLDTAQKPIPGLYAAGELVGGLFYFNYPGRHRPRVGLGVRQDRRHHRRDRGARALNSGDGAGREPAPQAVQTTNSPNPECHRGP